MDQAAFARMTFLSNIIAFSCTTLYAFDYLITFDQEVNYIWGYNTRESNTLTSDLRRLIRRICHPASSSREPMNNWPRKSSQGKGWSCNPINWLLVANRYVTLVVAIAYSVKSQDRTSCVAGLRIKAIGGLVQFLLVALLAAFRVYAVTQRRWLTILAFILNAFPIVANIYVLCVQTIVYIPGVVCASSSAHVLTITKFSIASRIIAMLGELLVVASIIKNTYATSQGLRACTQSPRLGFQMLMDGSIYFVAMIMVNLFYLLENTLPALHAYPPAVALVQNLPPMLVTRMFLALRSANDQENEEDFVCSALVFKGKSRENRATDDFGLPKLTGSASSDEEIAMGSLEAR